MSDTAITATLDRERTLDVRPHLMELERVTGAGIGRLVARVIAGEFHAADLAETVRLGLLGGGASPAEAATLSRVYVTERPLTEGHALATTTLVAVWSGKPEPVAQPIDPATIEAGEIILDVSGRNPIRLENDGTMTPLNPGEPLPAWAEARP